MKGKHTPIQTLSVASETVYEMTVNEGTRKLEVDLGGYKSVSVTMSGSSALSFSSGAALFSFLQGNEKGKGTFPITGVADMPVVANANNGRFDIPLSGRFLTLKSTLFVIDGGSITVTIMAKR